jgi:hypothetical protein
MDIQGNAAVITGAERRIGGATALARRTFSTGTGLRDLAPLPPSPAN